MSEAAHISSIDALVEFRAALCTFMEEARNAVVSLEMEVRRAADWLDQQARFWHEEVRRAEEAVIQARSELARRKMMRISDRPPDTTEQEKNLARARNRLEHAQEKVAAARHWLVVLPEEIRTFEAPTKMFQDVVDSGLPKVAGLLQRQIEALAAYAAVSAPAAEPSPKPVAARTETVAKPAAPEA